MARQYRFANIIHEYEMAVFKPRAQARGEVHDDNTVQIVIIFDGSLTYDELRNTVKDIIGLVAPPKPNVKKDK